MSEQDYETNNLSNNQTDLNGNMSGEPAAEWVAEPTPPPAAAANEPAEEPAAGSDPSEASGEPAAEWVAEPSLAQPGYAAYGRPDGYEDNYRFRSGAGDAYMPNVGSSGSDLANTAAAAEQSAAAGSAAAAAGTAAATGAAARAASAGAAPAGGAVTPPPAAPRVRPETPRRRPGVGWTVLMILLALLAGYLGARLQTKHITAKVTDGITNDIQAYMEEAGATVMYRSVNTQTESGDAAIDVASVAELASDSVVEIATEFVSNDFYSFFYSGSNVQQGAGSGVILSEDGYILTCYHVIENANSITVATRDGQTYEATLVGGDEEEDIAIIKVEAEGLTPAVMGDSDTLVVGSPVVAIGNPLGQLGGTVTSGIVSALERQLTIEDHTYTLIQTDTAINGGNSGGGLFNSRGELVGLVNAKAAEIGVEGLGFALPLNSIRDYIEDIVAHGYIVSKVTLGIRMLDVMDKSDALKFHVEDTGVYILYVMENSNAAYAGLQSGDRIVRMDDTEVTEGQQVIDIIGTKQVGDVVEMDIVRGGEEMHLTVTLYGSNQTPTNVQQTGVVL